MQDEYERKKALQDEENRAWQQKKNAGMLETIAAFKNQVVSTSIDDRKIMRNRVEALPSDDLW